MSPTCCTLLLPSSAQGLQLFSQIDAASSIVLSLAKHQLALQPVAGWLLPLQQLQQQPRLERGSAIELSAYQEVVRTRIQASLEACQAEASPLGVEGQLRRALALVNQGRTSKAYDVAVGLCGLAGIAAEFLMSGATALSNSSSDGGSHFKVPALPANKRSREQSEATNCPKPPQQLAPQQSAAQQHVQMQLSQQPQAATQQQHRKHSAPKRRATPQVLPGAPVSLTPAAPPASVTRGETVCDEQLLSCWCPISGKRQRISEDLQGNSASSSDDNNNAAASSSSSSLQAVLAAAAPSQQPRSSSTSTSSSSSLLAAGSSGLAATGVEHKQQRQQVLSPPKPEVPVSAASEPAAHSNSSGGSRSAASAARAAAHAEAVQNLTRLLHEDPSHSKPSADVLLFKQTAQQPIQNWSGIIKHKFGGRVVELCNITLQVPEPFLEEFPHTLYAADVRHRRAVSLGRHVVCRASLGTLSEHQLVGLSTMAKGQLVALCSLQTAELHLVPYFDNKNLVRMVGFLKIKSE